MDLKKNPKSLAQHFGRASYRNLIAGSDARRRIYCSVRQSIQRGTIASRRRMALDTSDGGRLAIDRDLGFRVFPPGTFPEVAEMVDACRELIDRVQPEGSSWRVRKQLAMDNLDMSTLTLDSPFLRFALRPDVLASVSDYLGFVPILFNIDVWCSRYYDDQLRNTQRFHCDWGANSQVRIFVFATDVGEDAGPLVVLRADKSKSIRSRIRYNYIRQTWIDDERILSQVEPGDRHALTGESGTVAMVDTSRCFHYGSRLDPDSPQRIVGVVQYFSPLAFRLPWDHRRDRAFRHLATEEMSELQRLSLGAQ